MKFRPATLLLSAVMLSASATSCINDPSVITEIDTKEVIREVKNRLQDHVNNLNDTITMPVDSVSAASETEITSRVPVVIENVTVKVSNNDQVLRNKRDQRKFMMGMLTMFSLCAMSIIIVVSVLIFFYVRMRNRNRVIEKAIENNYQLPDSFYAAPNTKDDPQIPQEPIIDPVTGMPLPPPVPRDRTMLESALKLIGTGVAIAIIFWTWNWEHLAILGIIPIFIGVGKLVSYLTSNK